MLVGLRLVTARPRASVVEPARCAGREEPQHTLVHDWVPMLLIQPSGRHMHPTVDGLAACTRGRLWLMSQPHHLGGTCPQMVVKGAWRSTGEEPAARIGMAVVGWPPAFWRAECSCSACGGACTSLREAAFMVQEDARYRVSPHVLHVSAGTALRTLRLPGSGGRGPVWQAGASGGHGLAAAPTQQQGQVVNGLRHSHRRRHAGLQTEQSRVAARWGWWQSTNQSLWQQQQQWKGCDAESHRQELGTHRRGSTGRGKHATWAAGTHPAATQAAGRPLTSLCTHSGVQSASGISKGSRLAKCTRRLGPCSAW